MKPIRLESERLILRPFESADAAAFSQYRSDPEVARYQGWEAPYSLEQAAKFITEMQASQPGIPGSWYQLAIELKTSAAMIGDCAFYLLENDQRLAEIGITLATSYQGKGYGTEAVACLLDYLFTSLGLHRVRANIDPENRASARVLEKIGMRHEGRWIESLWFKGCWASEDWYALLQREWLKRI